MREEYTKNYDINDEELTHNQRAFLVAYAQSGNLTEAARRAKLDRTNHYTWMRKSEGYKKAFEDAAEEAADLLETEARRRALEGVEEPVFYQGQQCGTVHKYSDTLLIFLLKGCRPEKYVERVRQETYHKSENVNQDITSMTREERQKRIEELWAKRNKDA